MRRDCTDLNDAVELASATSQAFLNYLTGCALSRNRLTNLVNVAAKGIRTGDEHLLYSRCINPLRPNDWR